LGAAAVGAANDGEKTGTPFPGESVNSGVHQLKGERVSCVTNITWIEETDIKVSSKSDTPRVKKAQCWEDHK